MLKLKAKKSTAVNWRWRKIPAIFFLGLRLGQSSWWSTPWSSLVCARLSSCLCKVVHAIVVCAKLSMRLLFMQDCPCGCLCKVVHVIVLGCPCNCLCKVVYYSTRLLFARSCPCDCATSMRLFVQGCLCDCLRKVSMQLFKVVLAIVCAMLSMQSFAQGCPWIACARFMQLFVCACYSGSIEVVHAGPGSGVLDCGDADKGWHCWPDLSRAA